ncbi:MAG: C10 family peptidase, partial [Bacteroidales bacterium]|nr:C10 family peptidase [Bacteroidales bacterium]
VIDFNNEDGTHGFSTVSADRRVQEVLSYTENGCIADTSFNGGLKMFLDALPYYLENEIRSFNQDSLLHAASPGAQTRSTFYDTPWEGDYGFYYKYIDTFDPNDPDFVNYEYMGETIESDHVDHGRILATKWDQGEPYNNKLPYVNTNMRALAGCAIIAAIQVMAYHGVPYGNVTSSDWASFATQATCYDTKLQDAILSMYNSIPHTSYDDGRTGITPNNLKSFLNNNGYIAELSTSPTATLRFPYLLGGFNSNDGRGHRWVVDASRDFRTYYCDYYEYDDGADVWRIFVYNRLDYSSTYIHCNWGWGGLDNGYYRKGTSYTADGKTYDCNFSTINIRVR